MVLPENKNFIRSGKKPNQDLPVPKHENHFSFTGEPSLTDLHDESFDSNCIPDSQPGFDVDFSFDDTNEKDSAGHKRPNKVVDDSSSGCDDDSSSSSNCDSTSTNSTADVFSSDDNVKDEAESDFDNYLIKATKTHVVSFTKAWDF